MNQAQIHTQPDAHARAFSLCAAARFSPAQALVMARGFAARGKIDASEGCTHYVMRLMIQAQADRDAYHSVDP
ncbi:hypothetical protein [Paraburkholderia adhaesiva]|uniref:hypothetical protein n=1 Tax=Paraburkholderia adhaesiva TaxID=2883244 RepID=UPI001F33F99A|nr:hypothetical protein [Paraburkholderia adhaesiva]